MKTKPVIIIIITLVIGFAIGFLTSSMIRNQQMKKFRSFNSVEAFKHGTLRLIEPSEEQKKKIVPIIDEYGKKMSQIRKDFGKEFFNLMKSFYDDIEPFLTDEQIKKLQSVQRPRRDSGNRNDSTGRGQRHKGPPPGRGR